VQTADIQIALNTAVTSRVYPGGLSEALLIVDEPNSGLPGVSNTQLACADPAGRCSLTGTGTGAGTYSGSTGRPNIFPGTVSGNFVTFFGIPIDPPGASGTRVFRFTNIRINAIPLSNPPSTPVIASFAISNYQGQILLANPTPTVGFVTSSLTVTQPSPVASITACSAPERAGVIRFSEIFGTAFKSRLDSANGQLMVQNVPSMVYYSESGFFNLALSSPAADFATVGLADSATRFQLNLGMPAGARAWVSLGNVSFSGNNPVPATTGPLATLVTNSGGHFAPASPTATLEGVPAFELLASPGAGLATATWEILGANPYGLDSIDFVVWVQNGYSASSGAFTAHYAPTWTSAGEGVAFGAAGAVLPIPRFSPSSPLAPLFNTTGGCTAPTATTLATSAGSVSTGTPVTLVARVTSSGGTPSGTVSLVEGSTSIATASLVDGTAYFTFTPALGTHAYTASYAAQGQYTQSVSAQVTVTVQPRSTATTLTTSAATVTAGSSVTLTGTVTSSAGTPTGTVSLFDTSSSIQSAVATANLVNGIATFVLTPSQGSHPYTAYYATQGPYTQSLSAPATVTVQAAPRTGASITLASSNSPSLVGQSVTFNATVSGGSSAPTGTVRFAGGSQTLGAATLAGGQATFTTTFTTARTHDIFAFYEGDGVYSDASARFGQMVNPVTPVLTLSANPLAATSGQSIAFSAQLSAPPPGAPAATGTVQFLDGAVSLGTAPLAGSLASITTATLSPGAHRIVAAFSGDANWYSARSLPVTVSISPAASTILLTAAFASHQTTLTATVNGAGSIRFIDSNSGAVLGTSQLAGGKASLVLSAEEALALAGHSVTAAYSGSESLLPGTSNPIALVSMINAAGNLSASFAPEELTTIYGAALVETSQQATEARLPESMGGIAVTVTDSAGASRNAGLFYVSPGQVNLVLPAGMANGPATLTLYRAGDAIYTVQANIAPVAPGIFTSQTSSDGENLYLVLYGTGIRNRTSIAAVTCVIDGQSLPVLYVGPQSAFAGLDQVNVLIPPALRGIGPVSLALIVDGQRSNPATVTLR